MKSLRLNIYFEILIISGLIAVFGFSAYQRNFVWRNDFVLWSDVVEKSPCKARGYNELGMYFYESKKPGKAIYYFRKSLFYEPEYSNAHNNLGLCFLAKGLIDLSIYEFRLAIKSNPLKGMYHINLGIAYLKKGWHELADREIRTGKLLRRKYPKKQ